MAGQQGEQNNNHTDEQVKKLDIFFSEIDKMKHFQVKLQEFFFFCNLW